MPPKIDIDPAHLAIVRAILERHIPNREVRVFGSRVTGRVKKFSDLDLAVMGDAPLTPDGRIGLAEAFDESDLPFKVDVVDWAAAGENFREIIRKDAIPI